MDPPAVDVHTIMHDIHSRLKAKRRQSAELYRAADKIVTPALALSLRNLESQIRELRADVERIGEIPPGPDTMRAKAGAFLARIVRRSLIWLIPSLQSTQIKVVSALEENRRALNELADALRQLNASLVTSAETSAGENTGKALDGDDAQAVASDHVAALIEQLEQNVTAQLQIQRELFQCLAPERARSLAAGRKGE
jgi:hypothetical protein